MSARLLSLALLTIVCLAAPLLAATDKVSSDEFLVRSSDAIVVGTVLGSESRLADRDRIDTVTRIGVEEVIKGSVTGPVLQIVEPGGIYGDWTFVVPGAPQFRDGARVLLFLRSLAENGEWVVSEMELGKLDYAMDASGREVLLRRDPNTDRDMRVSADRYLDFVRSVAAGRTDDIDDLTDRAPLAVADMASLIQVSAAETLYPGRSYTTTSTARRTTFPVTFYRNVTGAPPNADATVAAALGKWAGPACSNVNLVFGGTTPASGGLSTKDEVNSILFDRDLSRFGIGPFTCGETGYTGSVGVTGFWMIGDNPFGGTQYSTIVEGDVEFNVGVGTCAYFLNNGHTNTILTRAIGKTLGFRFSDRDKNSSNPCVASAEMECSSSAVMNSTLVPGLNGNLQAWDIRAVEALYPKDGCPIVVSCTGPTISSAVATPSAIPSGQFANLTVTATGTAPLIYQWFEGQPGDFSNALPAGTQATVVVGPPVTTTYFVRVGGPCNPGTVVSGPVTVTVNPCTPAAIWSAEASPSIVNPDETAWLTVTPTGTGPLSYQWYRGETGDTSNPVAGGAGPTLSVTPSMTTKYWARVTGACGAPADTKTLTVRVAIVRGMHGDFNGDGRDDILVHDLDSGDLGVWLMNGTTIQAGALIARAVTHSVAGIGDFDGDSKADILLVDTLGNIGAWLMDGSAIRSGGYIGSPGGYLVAGVADFTGDGKADILLRDSLANLGLWIMDGSAIIGGAYIGSPGGYTVAAVADFSGDGKADILLRDSGTGLGMWVMNGAAIVSGGYVASMEGKLLVGAGDIDADGKADIVAARRTWDGTLNAYTYAIEAWLMNGPAIVSGRSIVLIERYAPTSLGEYNGDGKADLLGHDPDDHHAAVFLLHPLGQLDWGYVSTTSPATELH